MNLINIEDLTKVYAERKLFDGASFSLQDGEKIGVIGINELLRLLTMWSYVICRSIRNSNRKKAVWNVCWKEM